MIVRALLLRKLAFTFFGKGTNFFEWKVVNSTILTFYPRFYDVHATVLPHYNLTHRVFLGFMVMMAESTLYSLRVVKST